MTTTTTTTINTSSSKNIKNNNRRRRSSSRGLGSVLREQRAKLYIIKRCVVMLLCWQD
ncbi:hypothetical protein DM860_002264 [Cuscuta australis]|uniref:Uncharacterized protein n=1 Tax=Cuscuta australis TaxID=267555 RepID=A0A328CYK0_9ASTE|nr:hypothetical protein DM860_002264 [Cuscuta australis]